MHLVKLLSVVFLALYLIIVGLAGVGVVLSFIPPFVVGLLALVSGVLLLIWVIKSHSCCDSCDKK